MSISPLAPGTTFIDSLNTFEDNHRQILQQPWIKHRLASVLNPALEPTFENMPAPTRTDLLVDYREIVQRQTALGFAVGNFHKRCAIVDPKNPQLFKIPFHKDFHLRNFHIERKADYYSISIIDNADFGKCFDQKAGLSH